MLCNKILCVILCMTSGSFSITWSAAVNSILTAKNILPTSNGLGNQLVDVVADGVQLALLHCRNVFKWDRWNCPESSFARKHSGFVTREQAYVRAILNAAIVYEITKRCSRGELLGCGCDPTYNSQLTSQQKVVSLEDALHFHLNNKATTETTVKNNKKVIFIGKKKKAERNEQQDSIGLAGVFGEEIREDKTEIVDWMWGGCSEDVKYGEVVAQKLMINLEKQHKDAQAYARLHNNMAGRLAVRKAMKKRCRCHGVSGSCALQTCWRQMSPFSQIANNLKLRYRNAISVNYEDKFGNAAHDKRDSREAKKESPSNLVFVESSLDYCSSISKMDWPGTKGRQCSRQRGEDISLSEKRSCRNICRNCGFKIKKQTRQIVERCECTFHWCCEVKCKKCTRVIEEYRCI